jgi:transcriptional regulator with XRE-family HTH domain
VGTKEGAAARGLRRGREITQTLVTELRNARVAANVSGRAVASKLGWSEARYRRFERGSRKASVVDVSAVAGVLGLELSASLHPAGDPIRDKGHQALIRRFRALLTDAWQVIAEMPLPIPGERRSWDLGLRLGAQRVGVEAETGIRDVQRLTRRVRERETAGGMDEIVLLLSDTRSNRRLLPELLEALGERFHAPPRQILGALREGRPIPGSGVILL